MKRYGFYESPCGEMLLVSSDDSKVALYVVPTDEELMIARHTFALIAA